MCHNLFLYSKTIILELFIRAAKVRFYEYIKFTSGTLTRVIKRSDKAQQILKRFIHFSEYSLQLNALYYIIFFRMWVVLIAVKYTTIVHQIGTALLVIYGQVGLSVYSVVCLDIDTAESRTEIFRTIHIQIR